MRKFEGCEKYYRDYGKFMEENKMLGSNPMWLIEILCEKMDLKPGVRVLDMGCGTGLTRELNGTVHDNLKPYRYTKSYDTYYVFHSAEWWRNLWQKTGLVDVTYAGNIPDVKELWRQTADYNLLDADVEDY